MCLYVNIYREWYIYTYMERWMQLLVQLFTLTQIGALGLAILLKPRYITTQYNVQGQGWYHIRPEIWETSCHYWGNSYSYNLWTCNTRNIPHGLHFTYRWCVYVVWGGGGGGGGGRGRGYELGGGGVGVGGMSWGGGVWVDFTRT